MVVRTLQHIFVALRCATARLSYRRHRHLSICLSVCLSQAGTVWRQILI